MKEDDMSAVLKQIQTLLKENSTEEGRAASRKFVPGKEKVYGVRLPVLNQLSRQFSNEGFSLVEELWEAGALEDAGARHQRGMVESHRGRRFHRARARRFHRR